MSRGGGEGRRREERGGEGRRGEKRGGGIGEEGEGKREEKGKREAYPVLIVIVQHLENISFVICSHKWSPLVTEAHRLQEEGKRRSRKEEKKKRRKGKINTERKVLLDAKFMIK